MADYTADQLDNDLNLLTEWGNLQAQQEMTHPKTIEEYRNKHFRYQITTVGIAIEEFIQSLPSEDENSGDLDSHLFERLLEVLNKLNSFDNQKLLDGWEDLHDRFDKIRRNATGYVAYLTSSKVEDLMQTTEFLVYKLKFIEYLREFIRKMQQTSVAIETALNGVSEDTIQKIIKLQTEHDEKKPTFTKQSSQETAGRITETWKHIRDWFIDQEGRDSEYTNLIAQTNEAMSRVTSIIQTITESNQQHRSRSKDYLQIASWYQSIVDSASDEEAKLSDANKLSSLLFSFGKTRHVQAAAMNVTNQLDELWKMEVPKAELTSKSRKNRARVVNKPFVKDPEKQAQVRLAYQKKQQETRAMWNKYLEGGSLQLSNIHELPIEMRHDLIRYFSSAMVASDHRVATKLGWVFEVKIDRKRLVTVQFSDGYLTMPDTEFKIVGGQEIEK